MDNIIGTIRFVLKGLILISIALMLGIIGYGFLLIAHSFSWESIDHKKIIKGVEYFFLAPLPLIIILAIYNYFKTVVANSLKSSKDADVIKRKFSTLAIEELSIAKYFFTSILISILFVSILEVVQQLSSENKISVDKDANLPSFTHFIDNYLPVTIVACALVVLLLFYIKIINVHGHSNTKDGNEKLFVDASDIQKRINERKKPIT